MDIAARFKMVRDSFGYSQREMAKKLDSSLGALQSYESGKSIPGGNVLEALARLGFNVNWLLTGEEDMRRGEVLTENPSKSAINKELLERIIEAWLSLDHKDETPPTPKMQAENLALFYDLLKVYYSSRETTVESIMKFMSVFSSLAEVAVEHGFANEPNTLELMLRAMLEGDLLPGVKKKN